MVPEFGTTAGSYQSRKPLVPYDFCVGKVTYLDSPPQRKPGLEVFLHGNVAMKSRLRVRLLKVVVVIDYTMPLQPYIVMYKCT